MLHDDMRLLVVELSHSSGTRTVLQEIVPRFVDGCDKVFYCGHNAESWKHLLGGDAFSFGYLIATQQRWSDRLRRRLARKGKNDTGIWLLIERFISENRVSHVFFPWLIGQSIPRLSVPSAAMFMDLLWRHYPEDFPDGDSVEVTLLANLQNVDITFPVSAAVAKELVSAFDLCGAKLVPVPHGSRLLSNLLTPPSVEIDQSADNSGYFLYPAQTTANKNHHRLFEATKILVEQGLTPKVVCTSRSITRLRDGVELSSHEKVLRQWLDANANLLEQNIILRGEVEWEELTMLYNHCHAVVLPSLYEGFGLPLLEAFERNAPVICSSIPTFLEQIERYGMADRVTVVDSVSPHSLASAMSVNMQCPRMSPLAKYELSLRLSRWTWEDVVDMYLRCLKECRLTNAVPLAKGGFLDS